LYSRRKGIRSSNRTNLEQVDHAHAKAGEGFIDQRPVDHGLGLRCRDGLAADEDAVAVSRLGEQPADHCFGSAVATCGVDHLATLVRKGSQHIPQGSDVRFRLDIVGIGADADDRQALTGGRDGTQNRCRFGGASQARTAHHRGSTLQDPATRDVHGPSPVCARS
jgi:hypothetical protein